jgi:L-seryl-tRNA(Ser) seleniumtransferase
LERLAAVVADYFRKVGVAGLEVNIVEAESYVGGGTLPYVRLPTAVVALRHERVRPHALSAALRRLEPPVLARATGDAVFVDMRSVLEDDLPLFKDAARGLSAQLE